MPQRPKIRPVTRRPPAPPAKSEADAVDDALVEHLLALAEAGGEALESPILTLLASPAPRIAGAIDALTRRSSTAAARALEALADAPNAPRETRKLAKRALHRMRTAGVQLEIPAVVAVLGRRDGEPATVVEAWATAYDGSGSRAVWMYLDRPTRGGLVAATVLNDHLGVRDATVQDTSQRRFHQLLDEMRADVANPEWVELPPQYARQLVQEGLDLNHAQGTAVPRELAGYHGVVGGVPFERALAYEEISSAEIRLNPQWVQESSRLVNVHPFEQWLYLPEQVDPYLAEIDNAKSSMLQLLSGNPEDRQEQVISRAIEQLVSEPQRHGLVRRLEETAYFMLREDRVLDARHTLAAAVALAESTSTPSSPLLVGISSSTQRSITAQPFLRAMVGASLALASMARDSRFQLPSGEAEPASNPLV